MQCYVEEERERSSESQNGIACEREESSHDDSCNTCQFFLDDYKVAKPFAFNTVLEEIKLISCYLAQNANNPSRLFITRKSPSFTQSTICGRRYRCPPVQNKSEQHLRTIQRPIRLFSARNANIDWKFKKCSGRGAGSHVRDYIPVWRDAPNPAGCEKTRQSCNFHLTANRL